MKKVLMILAVMLVGFTANASAQDQKMAVGVQGIMGTGDSFTNYGIGARFQYSFTENWRGDATFNYFLKKDNLSMYDVNVNVNYVFSLSDQFKIYPLAGIGLCGSKVEFLGISTSSSDFVVNLGAGVEYWFSNNLKGFIEAKEQIKDGSRFNLAVGVAVPF